MKNILKLTLFVLLLVSCKESPQSTESSGSAASKNMEGLMREVTGKNSNKDLEYARLMEELMAKKPLTNAQFMEVFPKKLGNLSLDETPKNGRDFVEADTQVMVGNYGNGTLKMEIIDATGNFAGQAIFFLKSYDLITLESDDYTKYSKKERDGILTSGVYYTGRNESELTFLYDNRFYITLKGKEMDVDKLWNTIKLDDLKRLKEFDN